MEKQNSVNPYLPTNIKLDNSQSMSFTNGDIVAVFDATRMICLDAYIWNSSDTNKVLKCSQDTSSGSNDGITTGVLYFQVWRTGTEIIEPLYVTGFNKLDSTSAVIDTNNSSGIRRIDGGATEATYANVMLAVADKKYRIYYQGVYSETVTNVSTYSIGSNSADDYDVTYYVDESSTSYSGTYSVNYESNTWVTSSGNYVRSSITSGVTSVPTHVTASDPNLSLGTDYQQQFTFPAGNWNLISFNTVDSTKTTVHNLFKSISGNYTKIIIFDQKYDDFIYTKSTDSWSREDEDVHFDSGYYVKVLGADGFSCY